MKRGQLGMKHKRIARIASLAMSTLMVGAAALALPAAAYATTPGTVAGTTTSTMTREYTYAEGDTISIPQTVTIGGVVYNLVSTSSPVLESSLPDQRTYTYAIDGNISADDLLEFQNLPGATVTPVDVVYEREVDKTYKDTWLPGGAQLSTDSTRTNFSSVDFATPMSKKITNNDVKKLPETMDFPVTSGTDPSGTEVVTLERAGVSYIVAAATDGLPTLYEATIVYRGIETYAAFGYYTVTVDYSRTVTTGYTDMYVVVATYEPAIPFVPAPAAPVQPTTTTTTPATTTPGTTTPTQDVEEELTPPSNTDEVEETPEPQAAGNTTDTETEIISEPDTPLAAYQEQFDNQTGNPLVDIARNNVPLGTITYSGAWSLLSMLLSVVACILLGIAVISMLMRNHYRQSVEEIADYEEEYVETDRHRRNLFLLTTLVVLFGALTLFTWILFDDRSQPIVWINQTTVVVAIFFAICCVFFGIRQATQNKANIEEEWYEDAAPEAV